MAFVVRRPRGKWEIRESITTEAGPRARTLATFRELDEKVLAIAEERAEGRFDAEAVAAAAREKGAPIARRRADAAASALLTTLSRGDAPSAALSAWLRQCLVTGDPPSAVLWLEATDTERAAGLADLLRFVDALPRERIPERIPAGRLFAR